MDDTATPINPPDKGAEELREWETPELIVESVEPVTRGGFTTVKQPGDDTFYLS